MEQSQVSLTKALVATAAIIIILAGIKSAAEIVVPFLLSLFIAIICSPIIKFMTTRRIPLGIAISLLLGLIVLVFLFLTGMVNNAIQEFTASIPQYKLLLTARLQTIFALVKEYQLPINISQEDILSKFDPSAVMNLVSRLLLGFSGVLSNIFVLFLVVIFMLLESPMAKYKLALALSPDNDLSNEKYYIDQVLKGVIGYLGIKTVVSALTGLSVWILLMILNVQYAVLWGVLAFLLNYIPNIGSFLAGIPIVLQALLLNGFSVGLAVLAGIVGINMLFGNVLEPKMMGKRLGLSTLVVFLSLLFWGWLLGTVGMLLSVPLTMALKIALESNPSSRRYAILLGDVDEIKR
ncbi:AI-2E family transporter [Actinobacillus equuli]|uniref:AI-2E family transporter n=1 Tax=Actinobacillus equuli TaxID=718 RepID=UPI0024426E8D|nr:AI-2E family transporter [Actinobacillus equuli]WGE56203.1 AI-2E family transporter [Actinobacillus equuli subsp. equuli]WGE78380.1 AI-2E family transporter [Actinobacillus equuli subsp. equuli]